MRKHPGTLAGQTMLCLLLFFSAFFSIAERALAASQGLVGYVISGVVLLGAYAFAIGYLKQFRNYTLTTRPPLRSLEGAYMGKAGLHGKKVTKKDARMQTQRMRTPETVAPPPKPEPPLADTGPILWDMDAPLPPPQITQGMQISEHTRRLGEAMENTIRMPDLPKPRPKTEEERRMLEAERRRQERLAREARARQRAAAMQAGQERIRHAVHPAITRAETVTRKAVGTIRQLPSIVQLRTAGFSRYYWTLILSGGVTAVLLTFLIQLTVLKLFGRTAAVGIAGYSVLPRYHIAKAAQLLVLVLIPAVLQEFLLRGALFSLFEQFGTTAAVFCSALAGACFSRSPQTAAAMFMAGLILGTLTYWTRSIWPAVGSHILIRLYALWISRVYLRLNTSQWRYFVAGNVILLLLFAYLTILAAYDRAREGLLPVAQKGVVHTGIRECLIRCGFTTVLLIFILRTLGQFCGLFYW